MRDLRHRLIVRPLRPPGEQPSPDVSLVARVVGDAGGDQRMCDLKQDGGATSQEGRHRRVSDAAYDALGSEVAISAGKPLRSRPTRLTPRTLAGFPSAIMKGGMSCTIFEQPPVIA